MKKIEKFKSTYGITLIALIITIIVLLILAGITINAINSNENVMEKAKLSAFLTEMSTIEENSRLELINSRFYQTTGDPTSIYNEKFDKDSTKYTVKDSLLQEIMYIREGTPSDKTPKDYNASDFDSLEYKEQIYVIEKTMAQGKENTYLWDEKTGVAFKIPQTDIGGEIYHSRTCALIQKGSILSDDDSQKETTDNITAEEASIIEEADSKIKYYEPNLKGFNVNNTHVVYYSEDFSQTKLVSVKEYIENGKNVEITENGTKFIFYKYSQKRWANVVTNSNGIEAWWVWIPRYNYKVGSNNKIDVAYTDKNNTNLNPEVVSNASFSDYIPHKAFSTNGLCGIWMSKFNAVSANVVSTEPEEDCYAPNFDGYDEDNTDLVYYSSDFTKTHRITLKEYKNQNKPRTITNEGTKYILYDYSQKIWANIVTKANNVEAWWVWIPRYAYNTATTLDQKMDIIFVKTDNTPYNKTKNGNTLQAGYTVHKGFTTVDNSSGTEVKQELQGLWMAKFNAVHNNITQTTDDTNLQE